MPAIVCSELSFHYDTPFVPIFEGLSLSIDTDWRTAVVGRNGTGKTTLLRLIEGSLEPGRGEIAVPLAASYFPFAPGDPRRATLDVLKDCVAPFARWEREMETLSAESDEASLAFYGETLQLYEEHGGYEIEARIEREFAALGMSSELLRRAFDTLSGGERTRALIVALFLRRDGFPLIDEPTNHLDIEGRELLGDYLGRQRGFVLVSHDRHFLDLCADHVLSLNREGARVLKGGYSSWKLQTELELEHEKSRRENLQREIRSLEQSARQRRGWSNAKEREKIGGGDKGFISHRAAKQMKRALSIEKRRSEKLEEKRGLLRREDRERRLKLEVDAETPQVLLTLEDARIEIEGRTIVDSFSLTLRRGDRTALVGPNGSGKTTLLRAIVGEIEVDGGTCHVPARLKVLRSYQTPLWERGLLRERIESADIDETRFRQIMGAFGVGGEVFDRPLETFSQGERKKVDLCRSFLLPAQLLLWDEPMNYIDVMSREQIETVILDYEPTILFVEHDRRFIESVATGIVELR